MEGNSGSADDGRLLAASWWRFEEYVLSDDGRIRPAPGARGRRYDPWEAFQGARRGRPKRDYSASRALAASGRRRVELPYQQLMSIAKEYSTAPEKRGVGRPRQTETALLAWCAKNGLLGLLHHQLLAARVPPAESERHDFGGMSLERTAGGWSSESIPRRNPRRGPPPGLTSALPSGTVLRWFPTGELRWDTFDGEWSQYFACDSSLRSPIASLRSPRTAIDGQEPWPPLPNDEAFWREYGEPLSMFVAAGSRLVDAVDLMRIGREQELQWDAVRAGASALAELAMPVAPMLVVDAENQWGLRWGSPSLLGSLALMAMGDIAGGARIISCRSCGVPAVTRSERGAYCSARCRERGPAKR